MNLIIVSKNDLHWNCLPIFRVERPLTEKLKFRHLDVVFGMLFFFGILKVHGFVYVRINFK